MVALPALTALAAASVTVPSLAGLALAFLKIGALLFGSGYVLVAFLRSELVEGLGWLTERQLLDAVAVGQVTPGPLFTTATFVGWVVLGPAGALVATAAIFLPGFLFVLGTVPVLERLRASARATAILDGVGAAALGLIAAVAAQLARAAVLTPVDAAHRDRCRRVDRDQDAGTRDGRASCRGGRAGPRRRPWVTGLSRSV